MPLINCLECNAIISDQAPSCPHCGIPQGKNLASIQCPECDSKISPQASSCPQCGIPLKKLSVSHSPSMPVGDDVKAIASIFSLAFFFSSQGRISRLQYALAIGCLIAVAILENLLLLQMLDSNAVFECIICNPSIH
jgi:predicted amidophosphoribosyltransferase